ncbi:MAG: YafY family transcriptional regulator [Saprospiraceae bacterium]|jgi:predicted DNA-binding transcriptional regulator YafY|uniref:helix-turn-helix transcriptional regulator n=1 Tax=Candidatus Brachybacter algidus TaxID=2982024 RepID=UPI001B493183|nr:YafY family protein [Candidatus Brachybacter algidus]MBP7539978.1 YafY family transcriptional regulator [Saprospiraceae bacterium]MBK7602248.1 YafY family transcriptional regulator [Candidatus Brachybacter algidus]MBK9398173.1 YafY family transcriptional regulator [Candidatus Brachybacter algidus]MBK9552544.1 YafY family transcriptional regulator [Candidatus Brachybacter algidus]MBL0117503.1 YafY family transcriptional regulator [Candidatus Brachybacter algidus]
MPKTDSSRLERLTAIITQLQTKRLITSTMLSEKFGVSVRTIYRDIRALEKSGIPIITQEGRGYSIIEGYRLPPIMFTEKEANALITAEQLLSLNKDKSFVYDLKEAINKIRAVLRHDSKDKAELLSSRVFIWERNDQINISNILSSIQIALTNFNPVKLKYISDNESVTQRDVEPFALVTSSKMGWYLIAWCRLRNDFRTFRLDRMQQIDILTGHFEPHKITMQEYYEKYRNF